MLSRSGLKQRFADAYYCGMIEKTENSQIFSVEQLIADNSNFERSQLLGYMQARNVAGKRRETRH